MIDGLKRKLATSLKNAPVPVAWAYRRIAGQESPYMDWRPLLQRSGGLWEEALARSVHGPAVLIGTSLGRFSWEINFDSALAVALTLRGARVHTLVCDRMLSGCTPWITPESPNAFEGSAEGPGGALCDGCIGPSLQVYEPLSLPIQKYGDWVTDEELGAASHIAGSMPLEAMPDYRLDGIAVGEHAVAGAIRYFGNADLQSEPRAEEIARRYLRSALVTAYATRRLMDQERFLAASGSHGIYVPQGIVGEVARSRGVRVVNWHQAYRQQCVIFSEGDTYHKTLLHEPISAWSDMYWDEDIERELMDYLESRRWGKSDWIAFHRDPSDNSLELLKEMGVDFSRPVIGLLTNVAWDAQLHYGATPFKNMMEWLIRTVEYFSRRPDLQLLIRIHPAEISGFVKSRQPALAEIRKAFPQLPPNVFIIPPESSISTYSAMAECNAVLIYATKTGIELTARGTPVLVAGEAWIKNKGFGIDASTPGEYFAHLDRLPLSSRLGEAEVRRARMYAYHFFFRRMIPIHYLDKRLRVQIKSLEELLPGVSRGMDVVCDGILNGTPFVYPAETLARTPALA